MPFSMNGANSPAFPVPSWILVSETAIWERGFPDCVPKVTETVDGESRTGLVVCENRKDAIDFASNAKLDDVAPLAITDLIVFLAVLTRQMREMGVEYVFRPHTTAFGHRLFIADAALIKARLADEIRRNQGR